MVGRLNRPRRIAVARAPAERPSLAVAHLPRDLGTFKRRDRLHQQNLGPWGGHAKRPRAISPHTGPRKKNRVKIIKKPLIREVIDKIEQVGAAKPRWPIGVDHQE